MLHLERNAISKLEPTGLLSSVTPKLRELYLTNNTITSVAKGALDSAFLGTLHLDSNQLTEIPTHALSEAPHLEELSLSQNSIRWVGPNAFQPISQSLKRLYMDQMGMEKVRETFFKLTGQHFPYLCLYSVLCIMLSPLFCFARTLHFWTNFLSCLSNLSCYCYLTKNVLSCLRLLISIKHKIQLRLMGISLVLQVFGHQPKSWTNGNIDLVMALEKN